MLKILALTALPASSVKRKTPLIKNSDYNISNFRFFKRKNLYSIQNFVCLFVVGSEDSASSGDEYFNGSSDDYFYEPDSDDVRSKPNNNFN